MYQQLLTKLMQKTMLSATRIGAVILLLAGLSSCGNKADLYLPEDTATTFSTTTGALTDNNVTDISEL
jgi:predicted small lipoprotein YifL